MERRLAAIIAADVVGYSRLIEADEVGTLGALANRRTSIIEPLVAEHRGRIVKLMGDGLLIEFASAVDSVNCAIAIQRGMTGANAALPSDRAIVLRIGINLGDVVVDGLDIQGDGVNIAARLEAMAEPGGICISAGVHEQTERRVPAVFQDLGGQKLKNISRSIRVYRVADAGKTSPTSDAVPSPAKASIAVLPFTNMSGDPEQEYFSDGITEDIITELSRFRSLFVIARNSSFTYKGRAANVIEVGRNLGVRYVAEGSVRRAGSRVRVTAQLVDAQSGSHLWAERFDREPADIFAVQDEVTRQIVSNIAPLLAAESLQHAKRKPPEDLHAYDCYLKGKELLESAQTPARLKEGREFCQRAIEIDPSFARAHAYKALSYTIGLFTMEADDVEEWRRQAMRCAEAAVALDAADGACHWAVSESAFHLKQHERCRAHIEKAVLLNPNDADVLLTSGWIHSFSGDFALGSARVEMAFERNPSHPSWYHWVQGITFSFMGRHEKALAALDLCGHLNADALKWRAVSLVELGRLEEARAAVQALLAVRPDLTIEVAQRIFDYLPNNADHLCALRRAGLPE
jgi:adenylate cyclase